MEFIQQDIEGLILIKPTIYTDKRGYFAETFRQDLLEETVGHSLNFVQDNESKSTKGVLRGLHYQLPPNDQAKLVRVTEGNVLDVVVDLRKKSDTFGQYISIELTADNKYQLFVPRGFAHGFLVLSESATFAYKVDNYYAPHQERGITFNDPTLGIDWRLPNEMLEISDKDKKLSSLSQLISPF